jgi:hypothetical protein
MPSCTLTESSTFYVPSKVNVNGVQTLQYFVFQAEKARQSGVPGAKLLENKEGNYVYAPR